MCIRDSTKPAMAAVRSVALNHGDSFQLFENNEYENRNGAPPTPEADVMVA